VLSIQSHVVHGYVGNKAATFPLQLLGFEVDAINTVQFSNHTGYVKGWTGDRLSGPQVLDLMEGLKRNQLLANTTHLLTGYIGNDSILQDILTILNLLKAQNPDLVFVCDPVMGDNGKLYVPDSLVALYRDQVISYASLLTPNLYELELLSQRSISTVEEALNACRLLHGRGVSTVVVTSAEFTPDVITVIASSVKPRSRQLLFEVERLPVHFPGSGDLTSALLLAWTWNHPEDLQVAVEHALCSVHAVLRRTHEFASVMPELQLIQSMEDLLRPSLGPHVRLVQDSSP